MISIRFFSAEVPAPISVRGATAAARAFLVATALLLTTSAAHGAAETTFWEFSSGNWLGGAYEDRRGSFSHCAISANYKSGITLSFGITAEYDLQLALGHAGWSLPAGSSYDIGLSVDGRDLGRFPAVVYEDPFLTIHIGNRGDILRRLQRGHRLRIRAAQEVFHFELNGTKRALGEVMDCVDLALSLAPAERNPFAHGRLPPASLATEVRRTGQEFQSAIRALLVASGLSEPEFINPAQIEIDGVQYAWTSGNIVGFMSALDPTVTDVDHAARIIIGGFASECGGLFASQTANSKYVGDIRLKKFFAACRSDTDGDTFIVANAVEFPNGVLMFVNTSQSQSDALIEMNDSLTEVLAVVFSE